MWLGKSIRVKIEKILSQNLSGECDAGMVPIHMFLLALLPEVSASEHWAGGRGGCLELCPGGLCHVPQLMGSTVFPCPCFLRGAGGPAAQPGCSHGLILHIHTYFSRFLKCQSFSSVDYFRLHSLLQIYCLAEKLQIKFQKERTILQNKRKMLLHQLAYC